MNSREKNNKDMYLKENKNHQVKTLQQTSLKLTHF